MAITPIEAKHGWMLEVAARNYTNSTREYYEWYIGQFVAWLTDVGVTLLTDITPKHIRLYQTHKATPTDEKPGWGEYTRLASFRAIRAWLNFCVAEGWLSVSPIANVRAPKTSKDVLPDLSMEDARRLLAACGTPRETALILFLLDTGARGSEVIAVNVGDVDMVTGAVRITAGKGRKTRTVYLGEKTRRAMLEYHIASNCPSANAPLWRNLNNDKRLTRNGLQQIIARIGERAGVRATGHMFRRTFALWSLRAGMDIYSLAALMGHESIDTLQRYLRLVEDDTRNAHRRYGAVDTFLNIREGVFP
jgi:integrase/recombinase XerD